MARHNRPKRTWRPKKPQCPAAVPDSPVSPPPSPPGPARSPLLSVRDVAPPTGVRVPTREVIVDGAPWTVSQLGASRIGRAGTESPAILSLGVGPGTAGGPSAPDPPARYFLARSLDEIPEEQLVSFIRDCAPAAG